MSNSKKIYVYVYEVKEIKIVCMEEVILVLVGIIIEIWRCGFYKGKEIREYKEKKIFRVR